MEFIRIVMRNYREIVGFVVNLVNIIGNHGEIVEYYRGVIGVRR